VQRAVDARAVVAAKRAQLRRGHSAITRIAWQGGEQWLISDACLCCESTSYLTRRRCEKKQEAGNAISINACLSGTQADKLVSR